MRTIHSRARCTPHVGHLIVDARETDRSSFDTHTKTPPIIHHMPPPCAAKLHKHTVVITPPTTQSSVVCACVRVRYLQQRVCASFCECRREVTSCSCKVRVHVCVRKTSIIAISLGERREEALIRLFGLRNKIITRMSPLVSQKHTTIRASPTYYY